MYPLSLQPNGSYVFHTNQGLLYKCFFSNRNAALRQQAPLLGIYDFDIYEFEFDFIDVRHNERAAGIYPAISLDNEISATIAFLVNEFLDSQERALIFVCDSSDGRGKERQRLFRRWHVSHLQHHYFDPVSIEIADENGHLYTTIYGGAFSRADMLDRDVFLRQLKSKAQEIILSKY
ncbi:DUF6169 family protein [Deminuibacter soli]|uniref:Uncharacterized protein n=1 Tax=Deminuibacter soli TaxID=2291815 RepID=A0A3E1NFR6_9BACT|nr:DUF6169 family protein [Deminuibacter soli]RFM26717.1 hypothetical protein DXN05_19305 [Deminuibacter soli]